MPQQEAAGRQFPGQQLPQDSGKKDKKEEMSWFYLMNHYNKENKALYKAQKEKKKAGKAGKKNAPAGNASDFAIPQQEYPPVQQPVQPMPPVQPSVPSMPPVQQEYPPVTPPPVQPVPQPVMPPEPAQQYQPVTPPPVQPMPQPVYGEPQGYASQQDSFDTLGGETTILDSLGGETTILSSPSPVLTGYLRRLKTGELIEIVGSPFRIGREQSTTNYCITDNTAISRNHAVIQIRDGRFFITDLNSSNATYVNGSRIAPGQDTEIRTGFLIRFANEDFDFIVQ